MIGFRLECLLAAACLISLSTTAQSKELVDYSFEELAQIRIATGIFQSINKAPAIASLITAEQIEAMGVTTLSEILETTPGLHVSYHSMYGPRFGFRGINTTYNPQTLVLINGIPITNLYLGDRNYLWGKMSTKSIARIEILRGPTSALHGAEAFAGTINIILKSYDDIDHNIAGVRYGSFNTAATWLQKKGKYKEFEIAFIAEFMNTDGPRNIIEADAQSIIDTIRGTNASRAPGSVQRNMLTSDLRLDIKKQNWRIRSGAVYREAGTGVGNAGALDIHGKNGSARYNIDITYHNDQYSSDWETTFQLSYLNTTSVNKKIMEIYPPGNSFGYGTYQNGLLVSPELWERHSRASIGHLYKGHVKHKVLSETGYYLGDLYRVEDHRNFGVDPATGLPLTIDSPVISLTDTPSVFLEEGWRENYYLLFQDIWSVSDTLELTSGFRHDHYSDFGSSTNPRLALVWQTRYDLTTKILYGQAFRTPSFLELGAKNNPVLVGNPNLRPEEIENIELGFTYHPNSNLSAKLNIYHYRWCNIIQFVNQAPNDEASGINDFSSVAQNSGTNVGQGVELEFYWQIFGNLELTSNLAVQRSKNQNNHDVADFPQHQFYLGLDWSLQNNWHVDTQFFAVMDRLRTDHDERQNIRDNYWLNITVRRDDLLDNIDLKLSIRNLFNREMFEPASQRIPGDLPLAGRNFYLELEYKY